MKEQEDKEQEEPSEEPEEAEEQPQLGEDISEFIQPVIETKAPVLQSQDIEQSAVPLEQQMQSISSPTQPTEEQDEFSYAANAPDYASSYEKVSYDAKYDAMENDIRADREIDITSTRMSPSLPSHHETQERMDIGRWRQGMETETPGAREDREYTVRAKQRKESGKLPFEE